MAELVIGSLAGLFCTISFLPQVIKVYKTGDTKALSGITFLLFSVGVFLWLIYGLMTEQIPVILPNAVIFLLSTSILVMKIKTGK